MGKVIALANQKGGVGKTTTTISLGAALGELGQRVLLVDFDPQGALSVGVGVNSIELELTIYNLLLDRQTRFDDVVVKTNVTGVELLPGNIDLSAAEVVLVSEVAREQALKRVLSKARDEYDFVLIDCPPSLGLLTVNALTAADAVIIPLECEFFALRGMALLVDTIEKVRDRLNPDLRIQGVVATMFDGRMLHSREVLDRVREAFGARLFNTSIPRTIRFAEAPVAGQPIQQYDSASKGAQAYRSLAKEILGIQEVATTHDDQTSEPAGSGRVLPGIEPDAAATGTGGGTGGDAAAPDLFATRIADPSPESGEPAPATRGEGDVLLHS